MGEDLERRKLDEQFRRELAERLKAVEIGLDSIKVDAKEINTEISKLRMEQLDLHYTLFGGPKADDVGLLEKFRKLLYRFGMALLAIMGVVAFAGKLIEPLYEKVISQWMYNSVSEKWMREQERPKVKHFHIYEEKGSDEKE